MASYPTAPVVFPARSDGQTIYSAHVNALQDEVAAIEATLLATATGGVPSPLVISGVRPTLLLDNTASPAVKSRVVGNGLQAWLFSNMSYDGTNFNLDDISQPGIGFLVTPPNVAVYYAAAGANPRTPVLTHTFMGVDGSIRERSRTVGMGEWTSPAFNAAWFTAQGAMTWTVAVGGFNTYSYSLVGKTCTFAFDITGTIGGTLSNPIFIQLPVTCVKSGFNPAWVQNGVGLMTCGGNSLTIYKDPSLVVNYVAGTCRVAGTISYAI